MKSKAMGSAPKKQLETIPEESKGLKGGAGKKNVAEEDILRDMKKNKAGGTSGGGASYQFN